MPQGHDVVRRRVRVRGTVQGVGFRPFVYRHATELGLGGFVLNDEAGVLIEVEGDAAAVAELCRLLASSPPPLARVASVEAVDLPEHGGQQPDRRGAGRNGGHGGGRGFRIVESTSAGAPAVPVSVDVATCADCLAEVGDPADRRYRYAFTNCTNCGPRYTIVTSVPYDRAATTMAAFTMCEQCRTEYEDPADRRFHAQPNACPRCGPALSWRDRGGSILATGTAALDRAVEILQEGQVVGVKGLGGYHLAVDAGDERGVAELRRRKQRDDKPFAVMVGSQADAERLCELSAAAKRALASPRRPIVLAPRQEGTPVAPLVAPATRELGIMLAYSPLHQMLLDGVGRPLVMTSGNLSDDPIVYDDDEAIERLGPLVDGMLAHDRPIHVRCDDSVVRAVGERVQMVRRSRGYAPEPITLWRRSERQVLAVGAELKSTVSVLRHDSLVTSHHIGDLEHLGSYRSFVQATRHLCDLFGVVPDVVAHDLHPEYLSTKWVLDGQGPDAATLGVQHHHAHVASLLVEHRCEERVLGVAFDGLGLGTDGTLWGGEFLAADLSGFVRLGHLRPVPMPGGGAAIREPWRMAMSWVASAAGEEAAAALGPHVDDRWRGILEVLRSENAPLTSSAGRLFDAVAALCGLRSRVSYEGQAAVELEAAAWRAAGSPRRLPTEIVEGDSTLVLEVAPLVAALLEEREAGTPADELAAAFHHSFAFGAVAMCERLAAGHGLGTVALTGGVFQNALLTQTVRTELERHGLKVLVHGLIPPNDGGISVGQAAIAAFG